MTLGARLAAIGAVAALAVPCLGAQTWRTLESSRQLRDSNEHHVRLQFAAGRINVTATSAPVLYSMQLRYDESIAAPIHRYDPEERALVLGVESQVHLFSPSIRDQTKSEMRVSLSRAVPIDLELELGATRATLDLGGLDLLNMRVNSGASETKLDFSTPNVGRLRALEIDVGAASLEARNLANANAAAVRVSGGVGNVDLDFGGAWTQDMTVEAQVALGKLTLRVPRDVGVRVEVQRFIASLDLEGMRKRGDAYYSENWDGAKYHLRVRAETTFGGIELARAPN